MSLINDALKRASSAMKSQPPAVPGAPLEPAPDQPKSNKNGIAIVILALLLAGGATYGVMTYLKGSPTTEVAAKGTDKNGKNAAAKNDNKAADAKATSAKKPEADNKAGSGMVAAVNKAKEVAGTVKANNDAGAATAETVQKPSAPAAQTASVTAPAAFPELALQGIYYRMSKPSARISGKTVYVGDEVKGAKVKGIDRESVTIEFSGQSKTLALNR